MYPSHLYSTKTNVLPNQPLDTAQIGEAPIAECSSLYEIFQTSVMVIAKKFRSTAAIYVSHGQEWIETHSYKFNSKDQQEKVSRHFDTCDINDHRSVCLAADQYREIEISSDFSDLPHLRALDIQTLWCVPLKLCEDTRATIVIYQTSQVDFRQTHANQLREFANLISSSASRLSRARNTHQQIQSSYAIQLEALNKVGQQLAIANSQTDVFNIVAEAATKFLCADRVSYVTPNLIAGECVVLALTGNDAIPQNATFPLAGSAAEVVMNRGECRHIDLTDTEHVELKKLASQGLREGISTPIRSNGKIISILNVATAKAFPSLDESISLFSALGSFLESALARIRAQETVKMTMDRLIHEATHDELTGLPNRSYFAKTLTTEIEKSTRKKPFAVAFIDLDGFKEVNDSLGHLAGDRLLTKVAGRMRKELRPDDLVARLGGDEFVILFREVKDLEDAMKQIEQMLQVIRQPYLISGQSIRIGGSVGLSLFPDHGESASELMMHSDSAMYVAKQQGKNRCLSFSIEMAEGRRRRDELQADLERAISNDEFFLEFQPQFDLVNQRILAVEALVRWRHPERGVVSPMEFIRFAEESRMISPISDLVIKQALVAVKEFRKCNPDIYVSVNVSAVDFENVDLLISKVVSGLADHGLPGSAIELELTEHMFLGCSEAVKAAILSLRANGVRVAIDDFGTGFSSLQYLLNLPIDTLKIDRSFVSAIDQNPRQSEIVKSILSMSRAIGSKCVAEGVENIAERDCLHSLGCKIYQGYFGGRPICADSILKLLSKQKANTASAVLS